MKLDVWMDRIMRWGFYLLFILVPLIVTPWNYELFEYNKMMVTYGLTIIIVGAWITKMALRQEVKIARTPLDIPLLLFVASQLVSTLFSMDPHISWFGYYSRFNGGMMSILCYAALYYAYVSNDLASSLKPLLRMTIATAVVVSFYGVAERLGVDRGVWVQDVQNRVFSTLGQPNWLAAYLIALIPITLVLTIQNAPVTMKKYGESLMQTLAHTWWAFATLLFFIVLLFTRSRSGYAGLALADIALLGFLFVKERNNKALQVTAGLIHLAFFLIVFVNGTHVPAIDKWVTLHGWQEQLAKTQVKEEPVEKPTGPALETGGTESGTIRKYVWQGAINAWKSSTKAMMIGTGTETFAFAFYQYRPVEHNTTSEWDFLYNKAHNEYLNYLATTGAFGLITYLLFLGTFAGWFIRQLVSMYQRVNVSKPKNTDTVDTTDTLTLHAALFAGWLSILLTNFFGFSVVIVQLFLFLFPALVISPTVKKFWKISVSDTVGTVSIGIVAFGTIMGIILLTRSWQADTLYASAYRLARRGQYDTAYEKMKTAVSMNSGEPVYHDEFSNDLAALAVGVFQQQKNATVASDLAIQSIDENAQALATSPNNITFWKTQTKIYYTLAELDPSMNAKAITALETAITLSPNDPKLLYNLAILEGRVGDNEKAVEVLTNAIHLKRDYRDAYYAQYLFFTQMNKPESAKAILEKYLHDINPNDKNFQDLVTKPKP